VATFKTLDQLEPRTPLDANHTPGNVTFQFAIAQAGSYYLTTNLVSAKCGIAINAGNVTLDLNGFALIGPGNCTGISPLAVTNIYIRNGVLRNWGNGVDCSAVSGGVLEDVQSIGNSGYGVVLGSDWLAQRCVTASNTLPGLSVASGCRVVDCTSELNKQAGIAARDGVEIISCTVRSNGFAGISAGAACVVSGCTVKSNGAGGITLGVGSVVSGCVASFNAVGGILMSNGCAVRDCAASGNAVVGIGAGSGSVLVGCSVTTNAGNGIVAADGCTVQSCAASVNATNGFSIGNGNVVLRCTALQNSRSGFLGLAGNVVVDCNACSNSLRGIEVGAGCSVRRCVARQNTDSGIYVGANGQVAENECALNGSLAGAAGIFLSGSGLRVEGNNLVSNLPVGIYASASNNFIIKNSVQRSATNFFFLGLQTVGPIVTNIAVITNNNPWANFSY
jgi:hypothetical protein